MNKKIIACLVLTLVASEAYLLHKNKSQNREIEVKDWSISSLSTENMALWPQFSFGLQNIGQQINDTLILKDNNGNVINICELTGKKEGNTLFCRISEAYCHECCQLAVLKLLRSEPNFDMSRVVFLVDCAQRAVNLQINDFGLNDYEVYNCKRLNIPAEKLYAPYYFVTDKSLKIKSLYVPSKPAFDLPVDSININLMYKTLIEP